MTGRTGSRVGALLTLLLLAGGVSGALASCARAPVPPEPLGHDGPRVRVNLGGPAFVLRVPCAYALYDADTGEEIGRGNTMEGKVLADADGLKIGGTWFPVRRARLVPSQDGILQVNQIPYWGELLFARAEDGHLTVTNLVRLEPYLAGVLGSELIKGWPEETLKAQAVAARTYAVVCREKRSGEPYDLTDDVMDQRYEGRLKETADTRRMAAETAGVVLTYRMRPFETYYCSVCGGHTGNIVLALNRGPWIPPLGGRPCPYCERGLPPEKQGLLHWHKAVPRAELEKALKLPAPLLSARPLCPDEGGHAARVRVAWTGGEHEMDMLEFRRAAGILSNHWKAEISGADVVFDGRGFGHGVGLCQWGAMEMGREGYDHREILRFYYPGADLQRLW